MQRRGISRMGAREAFTTRAALHLLCRAQTAPEGLPDSLVLAAINAGCGHSHEPSPLGRSGAAAAGPGEPSQQQRHGTGPLGPARSASNDSSNSAASGRPPMPVTPAFAPARSGSGGSTQQQRGAPRMQRPASYRELFAAQVAGLHQGADQCAAQRVAASSWTLPGGVRPPAGACWHIAGRQWTGGPTALPARPCCSLPCRQKRPRRRRRSAGCRKRFAG